MIKVGFIGAGNMGSALARAVCRARGTAVYICDKDTEKRDAVACAIGARASDISTIAKECDFVFFAVKPNVIAAVAEELCTSLKEDRRITFVTMAAGVTIEQLEKKITVGTPAIIRIMPNTPVEIGKGMIIYCKNTNVSKDTESCFLDIMKSAGKLDCVQESLIDAGTAISGCGPAYVYMFIEALADGGVACGLPRDKALILAAETLIGAASLIKEGKGHPEELKDAVCSPGGSTIAGVHALEEGAFRATASNAVISAYKKTLELGK